MFKLIYGEEPYLINKKIKEIIYKENVESYNVERIDGSEKKFSVANFIKNTSQINLFSDKKIFLLKNPYFLKNKVDDKESKELVNFFNCENDEVIIIIYNDESFSFKSNLKIFKELNKKSEVFYYKKVYGRDYNFFVKEILKEKNIIINENCFNLLISLIPNDLSKIDNEVEKLAIYNKEITNEVIISLIDRNFEDNLFGIINAIIDKNAKLVIDKINEFYLQNIYPSILISSIASQMRFMFCVKSLSKNNDIDEISSILNANPKRISIALNTIRKHGDYNFLKALFELMKLDQKIKMEYELDSKDIFLICVMKIIRGI